VLAKRYEDDYWRELDRINVERPDEIPHATQFVREMVDLIAALIANGKAYVVEGQGVYFQVDTQPDYGKLSHRTLPELLESAGARVDVDERKRSPIDFALWKAAKPGEPEWPSPWGPGRPGWHIECSAMSLEILGDGFDLHGGGDDLVFPHHENEIAQAEGAGHEFARYWVHAGMVMVGGEKMAKSVGNFRNLADALDAHGPRAFRLIALQTHYRRAMEINDDQLRAAAKAVEGLDNLVRRARTEQLPQVGSRDVPAFVEAMDDDFGTPEALGTVFSLAKEANAAIDAGDRDEAASLVATVRELAKVLGLEIGVEQTVSADESEYVEERIEARIDARARKDWAAADAIRDELRARGIELEDTANGTVWRRASE
jgi:cysteinyl-tRNA synthetase